MRGFAATLYALGFIEDFCDDWMRRRGDEPIDLRTFTISDADYADFVAFMRDKEVPYESDTRRALKALRKAAENDRFADLQQTVERLESEVEDDTQANLATYRKGDRRGDRQRPRAAPRLCARRDRTLARRRR